MAFKFLEERAAARKAEYMSHVRPEFTEWLSTKETVSYEDFEIFCGYYGMNSYERELMYPNLDDDALIQVARHCLQNCSRHDSHHRPCNVYDDAMMVIFVPMLLERLGKVT